MVKNPSANAGDAGDTGLMPGLGRFPGGNGNPLQDSCQDNPMDRGAWQATVHEVAKHWTRLSTHTDCKTLLKQSKDDISKWKHITCAWTGRLHTVKMSTAQRNLQNQWNPIKIPMVFSPEIEKPILKCIWNLRGLQIAKTSLRRASIRTRFRNAG